MNDLSDLAICGTHFTERTISGARSPYFQTTPHLKFGLNDLNSLVNNTAWARIFIPALCGRANAHPWQLSFLYTALSAPWVETTWISNLFCSIPHWANFPRYEQPYLLNLHSTIYRVFQTKRKMSALQLRAQQTHHLQLIQIARQTFRKCALTSRWETPDTWAVSKKCWPKNFERLVQQDATAFRQV